VTSVVTAPQGERWRNIKGVVCCEACLATTSCMRAMEMLQRPGMRDPVGMVSGLWTGDSGPFLPQRGFRGLQSGQ